MKQFLIILLMFFIFSCENEIKLEIIVKNCETPLDCEQNEECKFISIDSTIGECAKRLKCTHSYECDNNRVCQKDYELNDDFCGNINQLIFFTEELNPAYLYKYYKKNIEIANLQGEYYLNIIDGKLPNGISLSEYGVLSGIANDEIGDYTFTIEVINSPRDSNVFFNYIKTEKSFTLELKDNDPCNYLCNEYEYCDIERKECVETEIPQNMTRIYTNNGEVYQGVLIAEYNHNIWWWDSSDEYSYALFIENDFQEAPYDKSIKIFSSLDVSYIKSSNTYLNISEYDDFLKNNDMTLDLPLKDDVFVVVGNEGYHLEESGYGDFAYDFIKNDEYGNSYQNDGINNEDYFAWNEPVYLPVDGEVFEIHDGNKDNIPGEYVDESEANMVGIRLKGSYFVYLLHFKENTIPMQSNYNCERDIDDVICINVGDELKAGTYIGRVGNSGVSLVPHLHLTMFSYNSYTIEDVRMWSIPSLFKNIELLNGDPSYYDFYRPKTGDIISNMDNAIP